MKKFAIMTAFALLGGAALAETPSGKDRRQFGAGNCADDAGFRDGGGERGAVRDPVEPARSGP